MRDATSMFAQERLLLDGLLILALCGFVTLVIEAMPAGLARHETKPRDSRKRAALRSGRSVKSVADSVGFGSAAAFSRAFSREFGYSPARDKAALATKPRLRDHTTDPQFQAEQR